MGIRFRRIHPLVRPLRRRLLIEPLDPRRVLAAITGTLFDDANHSWVQDPGEAGVESRLIYVDQNSNGQFDASEPYSVTGPDGAFALTDLDDGDYQVRLFTGTDSQQQTFPIEATIDRATIQVAGGVQLQAMDADRVLVLTADALVVGNLSDGSSQTITLGDQLTKFATQPDGTVLVIGSSAGDPGAWSVDPATATVTPISLAEANPATVWSDVAIDSLGRGVAVEGSTGVVYALDATSSPATATSTLHQVAQGSRVISSASGAETLFAAANPDGMQVRMWSNETESFIDDPIELPGVRELLTFDETSGVLVARNDAGGINVYDVDNQFAALHVVDELTGPLVVDGARDLLLAVSPAEAALKVLSLHHGDLLATLAIDLSAIGEAASLAPAASEDSLVILGTAGATEIVLRKAAAQNVAISGGLDPEPIAFGMSLEDAGEPATRISLTGGFLDENTPGAVAGELTVFGQDAEQAYLLTADDDRFVVDGRVLKLRDSAEVDFETEPTIDIIVTAQEIPAGETFMQPFSITVNDQPEQPQRMHLTNETVLEFEPGATVGDVTLDHSAEVGNFEFTVDDPRFEFDGATLKLKEFEYVVRYDQDEIQLEVVAEDSSGQFASLQESFVITVEVNELPYHNSENPYDVNGDGEPSAADALAIINLIGANGPGPVGNGNVGYGYDVNGDGQVTALDALLIINELNRINTYGGTVGGSQGEGEPPADSNRSGEGITQVPTGVRNVGDETESTQPETAAPAVDPIVQRRAELRLKLVDASLAEPVEDEPVDVPPPSSASAEQFAENVDRTLRLLSDREA